MSQKTIIGGIQYETVGQKESNLLLKCNGNVKVQWGERLIDLVSKGKITSQSNFPISIINNLNQIKSDGLYILQQESKNELIIVKNKQQYNLTESDLSVSFIQNQNVTVEQQTQALQNIGLYYTNEEELKQSGLKDGIAFIIETGKFIVLKNGEQQEFKVQIQDVTVNPEKEENVYTTLNDSVKILLSIDNNSIIEIVFDSIQVYKDIVLKENALLRYDNDEFKLYVQDGESYLDIDHINLKSGYDSISKTFITYDQLTELISKENLIPKQEYVLTDFQNIYNIGTSDYIPLLLTANSYSTLNNTGYLYDQQTIMINYDHTYNSEIITEEKSYIVPGKITWMKDTVTDNEANFDFLHYLESGDSLFPTNSKNNKLIVYDLLNTKIVNGQIDNSNSTTISINEDCYMYNNYIECYGLTINCNKFNDNYLSNVYNLNINNDFTNNYLTNAYYLNEGDDITIYSNLNKIVFNNIITNTKILEYINSEINSDITNSKFRQIKTSVINSSIDNSIFQNLVNTTLGTKNSQDKIKYTYSYVDIENITITSEIYPSLYHLTPVDIFNISESNILEIKQRNNQVFRGMIVMHSGNVPIPEGWGICNGSSYTYNGITTITPDLTNRFIKAVINIDDVKSIDNPDLNSENLFTITAEHLPNHEHTFLPHDHTYNGSITEEVTKQENLINLSVISSDVSSQTEQVQIVQNDSDWENKSFKIEPNYYQLIFIMKL